MLMKKNKPTEETEKMGRVRQRSLRKEVERMKEKSKQK
jgi:hypothetical protein